MNIESSARQPVGFVERELSGALGVVATIPGLISRIRRSHLLALFFLQCCLLSGPLAAFEVRPLLHHLQPHAGETSTTILIHNTGTQPLPVDINTYQLKLHEGKPFAGNRADDKLQVFPPASLVAPGGSQVIRLQWADGEVVENDESYLVVIGQLPQKAQGDGVQMLLVFNVVVHVKAAASSPQLTIQNAQLVTAEELPSVKFDLNNKGSGHAFGSHVRIIADWRSGRREFSSVELAKYAPDLFLPPGNRRTITLPLPELPASYSGDQLRLGVRYRQP